MRPCECCTTFRTNDAYRFFQDRCPWCQARMIQVVQRDTRVNREATVQRCTAVIKAVKEWGLDESRVRTMAKEQEWAVQPEAPPQIPGKKK